MDKEERRMVAWTPFESASSCLICSGRYSTSGPSHIQTYLLPARPWADQSRPFKFKTGGFETMTDRGASCLPNVVTECNWHAASSATH